jgi:hypothetical protein
VEIHLRTQVRASAGAKIALLGGFASKIFAVITLENQLKLANMATWARLQRI